MNRHGSFSSGEEGKIFRLNFYPCCGSAKTFERELVDDAAVVEHSDLCGDLLTRFDGEFCSIKICASSHVVDATNGTTMREVAAGQISCPLSRR